MINQLTVAELSGSGVSKVGTKPIRKSRVAAFFSGWVGILIAITISGFPLVTFLPDALGFGIDQSRLVSVPFYGACLALNCLLILRRLAYFRSNKSDVVIIPVCIFFVAYALRFFNDAYVWNLPLQVPREDYVGYIFGLTLPGLMAAYLVRKPESLRWTPKLIFAFCALVCILAFLPNEAEFLENEKRKANSILNPISFGHVGGTLILMSCYFLVRPTRLGTGWMVVLGALSTVALGTGVILASASRGPIVSLAVAFALFLAFPFSRRLVRFYMAIIAIVFLFAPIAIDRALQNGVNLDFYMGSTDVFLDSNGRDALFRNSWDAFTANPLLGASLEERIVGDRPHNVILEALMTTGIFAGGCLIFVFFTITVKALKIMRYQPELAWLALLWGQLFTGAMFSGSIAYDPPFWCVGFCILGLSIAKPVMVSNSAGLARGTKPG